MRGKLLQQRRTLRPKGTAGFSLIELLVVLSIAAILLASVSLFDTRPRGKIAVDAGAQLLSQQIRQSMLYGLSIIGFGNNFDVGYGVRVDLTTPTFTQFYVDSNNNHVFDSASEIDTYYQKLTFPSDVQITKLCVDNGGAATCYFPTANNKMDVSFSRADIQGIFTLTPVSGSPSVYSNVSIFLGSISKTSVVEEVRVSKNGLVDIIGI